MNLKQASSWCWILGMAFSLLIGATSCSSTADGPNSVPVAITDPDRSALDGDSVVLDGSTSYDPDGDQLFFEWSIIFSPSNARQTLQGDTSGRTTLLLDAPGQWLIQLTVSDGLHSSAPALTRVSVGPASREVHPQEQNPNSSSNNGSSTTTDTTVARPMKWLYWTASNGNTIERLPLDGSRDRQLVVSEDGAVSRGFVVDASQGKLSWGSVKDDAYIFYVANLDGSGKVELFRVPEDDKLDPETQPILDLAYDPTTKTLYWTLEGVGAIYHWSALSLTIGAFSTGGKVAPRGLAVDSLNQRLYFTDSTNGGIYQLSISSQALVQVLQDVPGPADIELDPSTADLVWTDMMLNKIQSVSQSDFLHPRDIMNWIPGANQPLGLALDQQDKLIYWCDYKQNRIWKTAMNGTSTQEVISVQTPLDTLVVDIP